MNVAFTLLQCWHRVPGGTATSTLRLARELATVADLELIPVGSLGARPAPPWEPPAATRRIPLPYPAVYEAWHRFDVPPLRWTTGRTSLIHATTTMVPPSGSVPLVVTVHDVFPATHPERFTPRGARLMQAGLDRARSRAAAVIVPTQATADGCAELGYPVDRIRVIPWGVDSTPVSAAQRDAVRHKFGLERPFVLWVGTSEPRKNLHLLLDVFAALGDPDVDLVLVGPDGWGDGRAPQSSISARVHRLGFVHDEDLRALYSAASVFAFPSLAEGFGLPVLEAMAQGTAVVTSTDPAVCEVGGSASVQVDVADRDGWVDSLRALLHDDTARSQREAASRERAAEFQWSSCAAATASVYREALG